VKTRLMHVRANVRNLRKAIDWYRDVLGFEPDSVWPRESPVYADFHSQEGATFSIGVSDTGASAARFNFAVQDVDALWEQLKDKADVVEALFDTPYGTRKFTIRDIDNNELGFSKG
jgi:uncharacterized glyoxalase superfamily protein PhnB